MLRIVLGPAGSGKSEYVLERLAARAAAGQRSILIVPEQSSFTFEKTLYLRLEGRERDFVEVKSFRKLCGDIFKEVGGGALRRMGDAERAAVVRRALAASEQSAPELYRYRHDAAFCLKLALALVELKNAGVTPERLGELAPGAGSRGSQRRFSETAALFAQYEKLISGRLHDPADELTAAAEAANRSGLFAGKAVFLDGYTGFTEPESDIIERIFRSADELCVTLCCDSLRAGGEGVFSPICDTARRLIDSAERAGVEVLEPIQLSQKHRFRVGGAAALEGFLAGRGDDGRREGLYYMTCRDRYEEAEAAAAEIARLVREDGYNYSDVALIVRSVGPYRAALRRTFARFDIPVFCDFGRDMSYSPGCVFFRAALGLLESADSDGLLRLLKTSLCAIDEDEIQALENYAYIYDLRFDDWLRPFTRDPAGFGSGGERSKAALEALERSRKRIEGWLAPFLKNARGATADRQLREIYSLMERSGAAKRLLDSSEPQPRREAALFFELLDSLYDILADDRLSPRELCELFSLLTGGTSVEDIPHCLEQVQIGEADRIRTDNPRAVFCLGLNENVFPKNDFDAPLFTFRERDYLCENGAAVQKNFSRVLAMEDFFLYRALSCACERVYMSCAGFDPRSGALSPQARLAPFLNRAPLSPYPPGPFDRLTNTATARRAYAESRLFGADGEILADKLAASGLFDFCDELDQSAGEQQFELKDRVLTERLLGDELSLSPTRVESFHRCHFAYFLNYVLRVRPLKKAELSPIEAGSFVHAVLEEVMRQLKGDLNSVERAKLFELSDTAAEGYVLRQMGESATLARIKYLVERLKAGTRRLLLQLAREQEQSEFRPVELELPIARGGRVEPAVFELPDGKKVFVEGKIDRVDSLTLEGETLLRVIDYKTGSRDFSLSDVWYGLNLQMLIYLFSVCRSGSWELGGSTPAGVLYVPSDPGLPSEEDNPALAYRMDGLLLDRPEIISAMDRSSSGLFLPIRAGSSSGDKLASAEALGRIEKHIEQTVVAMAESLYGGQIEALPTGRASNKLPCQYCEYTAVCRRDRLTRERLVDKDAADRLLGKDGKSEEGHHA